MAKQVNVFLENRPGRVASVTGLLADQGINIRAITIQDRGDYGLMKLLLDRPEEAHLALQEKGFASALKDVLAVRVDDRPGGLHRLASAVGKHGVNILDGYGFVIEAGKGAVWCAQVEDPKTVRDVLQAEGFEVLEDEALYSL